MRGAGTAGAGGTHRCGSGRNVFVCGGVGDVEGIPHTTHAWNVIFDKNLALCSRGGRGGRGEVMGWQGCWAGWGGGTGVITMFADHPPPTSNPWIQPACPHPHPHLEPPLPSPPHPVTPVIDPPELPAPAPAQPRSCPLCSAPHPTAEAGVAYHHAVSTSAEC